jgi:hypothetical protein
MRDRAGDIYPLCPLDNTSLSHYHPLGNSPIIIKKEVHQKILIYSYFLNKLSDIANRYPVIKKSE